MLISKTYYRLNLLDRLRQNNSAGLRINKPGPILPVMIARLLIRSDTISRQER
jgi:hypothetical protein